MSEGFVHSVKVPRLYKTVADVIKEVIDNGKSLKPTLYQKKHPNVGATFALAFTTLERASELNAILRKTQLLVKEERLNPWLARVLITELFWGKKVLKSDAKPIQTILTYENELREALNDVAIPSLPTPKRVKPRYIRINTLMMTTNEAIQDFENDGYTLLSRCCNYQSYLASLGTLTKWTFIQDFHVPELFAFAPGTLFQLHPGYNSGALVLQDKASCLPAYLLNPKPGSVVVDMCAAPGMKTTHLAAIMQDKGKIYCMEMNERRYGVLCDFIEASQARCIDAYNRDALTLTPSECPDVEYILVDPSCSGSGMDRPDFDGCSGKTAPLRLKNLQSFQVMLLRHALLNFPTVKRVVYSTCSVYAEENEMVIDEILEDIGESYKLVPGRTLMSKGWKNFSSTDYKCKDNCLYARPGVDYSNGFFVAVFERNFNVPLPEYKRNKLVKKSKFHNKTAVRAMQNAEDIMQTLGSLDDDDDDDDNDPPKKRTKTMEIQQDIADEAIGDTTVEVPKKRKKTMEIKQVITDEIIDKSTVEAPEKKKKTMEIQQDATDEIIGKTAVEAPEKKKKKKKFSNLTEESIVDTVKKDIDIIDLEDETLTKKKKKKKEKSSTCDVPEIINIDDSVDNITDEIPKKKKKKKKKKESNSLE